ncbi:MAG: UDP-3-O-acyl-N-acetylglucosamine deacetylase [Pseudomonadota bacterium]
MQTTLTSAISFTGVGLHTGRSVRVTLHPASVETGIWFRRIDIGDRNQMIPAHWASVISAELCTKLGNDDGVSVSTVEHLMAAIAGTGLCNLVIDVDGPEIPILDGSSAPFVSAILKRGIRRQDAPVRAIEVLKPVEVRNGDAYARLLPATTLEISFEIEFDDAAIGQQQKRLNMSNGAFVHELCDSRTFCRQADVDAMHANGLALGGEPGINAVVFDGDRVSSPGGLRHRDEPVRHKMLDALGDLALAGIPLLARYEGHWSGHAMTNALLRTLFARPDAFRLVECDKTRLAALPGAGLTRNDAPVAA